MIRVAVDSQIADVSRAGIGQWTSELLDWLARDQRFTVLPLRPTLRTTDFSMLERLWWDQVIVPTLAARVHADVILKPAFSVPIRSRIPTVMVLNDLAARRFPHQLHRPSAWFYGHFAPWTLRFASRILTISDYTAREAVELLHLPSERFVTVLQGGDPLASPDVGPDDAVIAEQFKLPEKYFVHIGTLEPRKNLAFLVRAFTKFAASHAEYQLLLIGKEGWKSSDLHVAIVASAVRDRIRLLGAVTDREKRVILRRSRGLLFPSLYEGFGLPPLEAMRSGVPVVASRTSSIPEVVDEAGLLLTGYNEETWAAAIGQVATDETVRARLRTAGLERARQFSWHRTAQSIAEILQQVVHEHSR